MFTTWNGCFTCKHVSHKRLKKHINGYAKKILTLAKDVNLFFFSTKKLRTRHFMERHNFFSSFSKKHDNYFFLIMGSVLLVFLLHLSLKKRVSLAVSCVCVVGLLILFEIRITDISLVLNSLFQRESRSHWRNCNKILNEPWMMMVVIGMLHHCCCWKEKTKGKKDFLAPFSTRLLFKRERKKTIITTRLVLARARHKNNKATFASILKWK